MEVLPRIARRRTYVGAILSKAERFEHTLIGCNHKQTLVKLLAIEQATSSTIEHSVSAS